ncbi:hypothetical protein DP939_04180 [Spongiactinospora rosea]|uniref:Uncharacterized protein n=1 Tax=Spongiactinospora rosea TaxID=2248750 RepID=A0A366M8K7_9ACTN|nr:hypothetical protein [Spongiactinospora rosea]RBQ21879.1 hypothetical protein DP939_04180 [Spongiactinospora rosea]
MTHPLSPRHTPLTTDERPRAEATFTALVTETLTTKGRFRVTADTPDMVELFQAVARRAGESLGRPVVSYANGRDIVITFADNA